MNEAFSDNDNERLDLFFDRYRAAFPDPEPGVNFMPQLWSRIESRHTFSFVFGRLSKTFATISAGICLLLAMLNLMASPSSTASYTDSLLSDSSAEQTYYTEAIRSTPAADAYLPH